jgi:hypothetical protein
MHLLHRAGTAGLLVLAALLLQAGCTSKRRAVVRGQIMFFDKKLTAGTVYFHGANGQVGAGPIDFNGNYEVNDAPVGSCTITVRVPQAPQMPPGGGGNPGKPPKGMPPMRAPGGEEAADSSPAIDASKIVKIPGKYTKPESSGLTYTVEPGENKHDITLSP